MNVNTSLKNIQSNTDYSVAHSQARGHTSGSKSLGSVKYMSTSLIESLEQRLSPQEREKSVNIVKKIASELSIDDLSEEEIEQVAYRIKRIIEKNQENQNTQLASSFTEKEYSLEKQIELDVWHSLNFFSWRKNMLQNALKTFQVAKRLRISEKDVRQKIQEKTLLAIDYKGEYRFPEWQFDTKHPRRILKKLPSVLNALDMPDIAKLNWLTNPNTILNESTPLDILKSGSSKDQQRVIEEAHSVGRC